ncbi:MAG: CpsD/CapB family tyrosine-protein kinase, partial [Thermodesulfobacteriota bacterium]|nr:CpsD/CapB family tyrosine-protein kinase [Thermodesulfobacteriota bacterium]
SQCRVVLVDANFRHPSLHKSFDLPARPGFSDVVQDGTDVLEALKESAISNLFVLASGVSIENPMSIFESDRLNDVMEALKKEFDWIIFDCAPIKYFPDSSVLTRRLAGEIGVVLVVRAEHKHADIAAQAKERMEETGGEVLGAVLNRQRYVIPEIVYRRL